MKATLLFTYLIERMLHWKRYFNENLNFISLNYDFSIATPLQDVFWIFFNL